MGDSLDTVELVMALEDEGGLVDLSEPQLALLKRISCSPRNFAWVPPDQSGAWAEKVRVIGRDGRKVLFHAGLPKAYGVGCMLPDKIIRGARVYPSLSRAMFAFSSHQCPE
jgi:hypothetical protein